MTTIKYSNAIFIDFLQMFCKLSDDSNSAQIQTYKHVFTKSYCNVTTF